MNIIEIINQIEADKRNRMIAPTHAIKKEITERAASFGISPPEVDTELNNLQEWGVIYIGDTINDKYIQIL